MTEPAADPPPITAYAAQALSRLAYAPVPSKALNAGLVRALLRGPAPLAKVVSLPSPYPAARGEKTAHLEITEAGRAALATFRGE